MSLHAGLQDCLHKCSAGERFSCSWLLWLALQLILDTCGDWMTHRWALGALLLSQLMCMSLQGLELADSAVCPRLLSWPLQALTAHSGVPWSSSQCAALCCAWLCSDSALASLAIAAQPAFPGWASLARHIVLGCAIGAWAALGKLR